MSSRTCVLSGNGACYRSNRVSEFCSDASSNFDSRSNTVSIECMTSARPGCLYFISGTGSYCPYRDDIFVKEWSPIRTCDLEENYCKISVQSSTNNTSISIKCDRLQTTAEVCSNNMVQFVDDMTAVDTTLRQDTCSDSKFGITIDERRRNGNCRENLQIYISHVPPPSTTGTTNSFTSPYPPDNTTNEVLPPPPGGSSSGSVAGIVVGSLLGLLLVVAIIALLLWWFKRKRKSSQNIEKRNAGGEDSETKSLDYEELQRRSTKNKYDSLNVSISNVCLENRIKDNSSMSNFFTNIEENPHDIDKTCAPVSSSHVDYENETSGEQNVYIEIVDDSESVSNKPNSENDTLGEEDGYIVPDPLPASTGGTPKEGSGTVSNDEPAVLVVG